MSNYTLKLSLPKNQAYPKGLFIVFFVLLFAMIGYAMTVSLLVLYATKELGFVDHSAYTLYAAYGSLVFSLAVLGGALGSRLLTPKFAVASSFILSILGLLMLTLSSLELFYFGLGLYVIGIAIWTPNIYVILGHLYGPGDHRRDSGFTLCYIGMNVGAFTAMVLSGYVVHRWGFHRAFLIGAIATLTAFVIFLLGQVRLKEHPKAIVQRHSSALKKALGVTIAISSVPVLIELLKHASLNNMLQILIGIGAVLLVFMIAMRQNRSACKKLLAFLTLTIIAVAFWSLYMLAPTVLTIFIERNVDRHVFGWTIPTASFISLNPFFIVTVGLLLSALWLSLGKRGKAPSTPTKFAIGVILMGVGYLVLAFGMQFANKLGFISTSWIVLSYFLQTTGELFVSPIGMAMVGILSPVRYEGLMMGIWQLTIGVAGALSGFLAVSTTSAKQITTPLITDHMYTYRFLEFGLITVAVGIMAILLIPKLNKAIANKNSEQPIEALQHA